MDGGRPLSDLGSMIADKDIALVGNASSLFNEPRPIDSHEIVVRINKGHEATKKSSIAGNRTDILMISNFCEEEVLTASKNIVWMTPKYRDKLSCSQVKNIYFYPVAWWKDLFDILKSRPSTGCMAVDLVLHLINNGRITLYGFDFWRTQTWYTKINRPGPHSPLAEENYIRAQMSHRQFSIVF
ncbi:hypothetical protein [Desulfolutivibrio sulfoxidireducens]|uniref:hypothetical protein n=1 Tax=Desulfolutivibrio sulfoxidireducens TaxID=2773299 RepID=UPI00159DEE3E|nr:hypothetical protein [Desulfolutivibrio sulfoxidireducens]QLA18218.1 hypothetical protein GD605_18830 [Desulfolutivibrio sulfoxidireducens]